MLGANGAGKTTLIRASLGLVPIAQGSIRVLGRDLLRGSAAIGYLPQNLGPLAGLRLPGYDIVASAANGSRWGLPRLDAAQKREIDWALSLVDARDITQRPLN